MRRELTIATPCCNEAEALPAYFRRIDSVRRSLLSDGWSVRQLIIDDGSRDETGKLLADYARERDNVGIVRHPTNLGYGAAIKTALALTRTEWLAFVDADTNYDQGLVLDLARRAGDDVDIINVSVFAPGGSLSYPWYRVLTGRSVNLLYKLLLPRLTRGVHTMTCGFRLYRSAIAPRIFPRIDNFAATAEIILRALQEGLRVVDFPARNYERRAGRSKMRFFAVTLRHLRLTASVWAGRLGAAPSIEEHLARIGR